MAGDKITLAGKSRPLSENPIGEKKKKKRQKKKEPRQKLSVGLLKCSKSCFCALVGGDTRSGAQVFGSHYVLAVYSLNLSFQLRNTVWRTVFT